MRALETLNTLPHSYVYLFLPEIVLHSVSPSGGLTQSQHRGRRDGYGFRTLDSSEAVQWGQDSRVHICVLDGHTRLSVVYITSLFPPARLKRPGPGNRGMPEPADATLLEHEEEEGEML